MTEYACPEERFLRDVAEHQMTVLRDDGLNRHLRFKKPGSGCYWFDIVTWPGILCVQGDCGCYVFQRIEDMFAFFRIGEHDWNRKKDGLSINPGYWQEKVLAESRHGKIEEFDKERFSRVVNEYRVGWMRDCRDTLTKDERRDLWEAVEHEVLYQVDDGEHAAFHAAHDFEHKVGGRSFHFTDFFDHRFADFTFSFIWNCYAIAWAVKQYDGAKAGNEVAA